MKRTSGTGPRRKERSPSPAGGPTTCEPALENLSHAVRFETVSHPDPDRVDPEPFLAFHRFLDDTYPGVHRTLKREEVGGLSLLYTWEGSEPGEKPHVVTAHMDVVPVEPGTEGDWRYPPFRGLVEEGYVWGRGTLDCKGILLAVMEAVERLVAEGFRPRRTVYLAFGHDEEVGGHQGAAQVAVLLASRGVQADLVLDEGGFLVMGGIPGLRGPLAAVGVAEKGYLALKLSVRAEGGHSSMPPRNTAVGILARAVHRLEESPFPARLGETGWRTLENLAPRAPFFVRPLMRRNRLLEIPLTRLAARMEATNALVRTTAAVTMIRAGTRENVLPQEAAAVVNLRLLPGDGPDYVLARTRKVVKDPRVRVEVLGRPPGDSAVSDVESQGYRILERIISKVFPDAAVVPILLPGMSDARHYAALGRSVFRFAPLRLSREDRARAHGTDERLGTDNYLELIRFYGHLFRDAGPAPASNSSEAGCPPFTEVTRCSQGHSTENRPAPRRAGG